MGSIPAWAGQPCHRPGPPPLRWVYPRVGGATAIDMDDIDSIQGLSPRGRGNRHRHGRHRLHPGSIPAWAGQPSGRRWTGPPPGVYPRVGGATGYRPCGSPHPGGLSPRGRGNRPGP